MKDRQALTAAGFIITAGFTRVNLRSVWVPRLLTLRVGVGPGKGGALYLGKKRLC